MNLQDYAFIGILAAVGIGFPIVGLLDISGCSPMQSCRSLVFLFPFSIDNITRERITFTVL